MKLNTSILIVISSLLLGHQALADSVSPQFTCKAVDTSLEPLETHDTSLVISGKAFSARQYQEQHNYVWEGDVISLYVAIKPSSFGSYHDGTLSHLNDHSLDVALWCYAR